MKFSILVAAFCSSVVFAGVAENKAKQAGDKAIEDKVAAYKTACGADVKVESAHLDAGKIVVERRTEANVIAVAADVCAEAVSALGSLCKDADYKAEVAKIKTIKCTPKKIEKAPYWEVKRDGTTISVTHAPTNSYYIEGIALLKKLF